MFLEKHHKFKEVYEGGRIDYDKRYGYQCIDLIRFYAPFVFGQKLNPFGGSAINGWITGCPFNADWRRTENKYGDKTNFPKVGDIVFFGKTAYNPYGHVAIVDEGTDGNNLYVLETNAGSLKDYIICQGRRIRNFFASGLGENAILRRKKKYKDVLGWYTYNG